VRGIATDVGTAVPSADVQTLTIDWGDGSQTVVEDLPLEVEFQYEHHYPRVAQTFPIQVTVEDDDTGSDSVALQAANNPLRSQGIMVEEHYWGDDENTWFPSSDPLWAHDEHRWSTTVLPTEAVPLVESVQWFAEPWEGQTEPLTSGSLFAEIDCACPALGSPGPGDWFVWPVVAIPDVVVQGAGENWTELAIWDFKWGEFDEDDAETNLFTDTVPNRIFPERNHPEGAEDGSGNPIDQKKDHVYLTMTIVPAVPAGKQATLNVKLFDPDNLQLGSADPNDPNDTTFEPDDNRRPSGKLGEHSLAITPPEFQFVFGPTMQLNHKDMTITEPQPGNNYIAAAHTSLTKLRSLEFAPEDGTTLTYRDADAVSHDVPSNNLSPLLEVWRALWVETDHMEGPGPAHGPFTGEPGCGACDDVRLTPGDPTIQTLAALLAPANVKVRPLNPGYDLHDTIPWEHNKVDTRAFGTRDVPSKRYFWTVHLVGAYEWWEELDNDNEPAVGPDPNTEQFVAGWSEHGGGANPSNFVFFETARDIRAEPQWGKNPADPQMVALDLLLDRIAAHEALHRFFGWHGTDTAADEGIMDAEELATALSISLTGRQIRIVQAKDHPE
jgi:hypothetical protein